MKLKKVLQFIRAIGEKPEDNPDDALQKRFLVNRIISIALGGMPWMIIALVIADGYQFLLPLFYIIFSIINLIVFQKSSDYGVSRTIQNYMTLTLPIFFQWSLGGFVATGAVLIVSLPGIAATVTYQSNKNAALWLGMYAALVIISAVFDHKFVEWINPDIILNRSIFFFAFNIILASSLMMWLINFMVKGKNVLLTKLQRTQEQLIHSEKMATLGTLAAGFAHELNNPASASIRAATHLSDVIDNYKNCIKDLNAYKMSSDEEKVLTDMSVLAQQTALSPKNMDSLQRSDKEMELEDWLSQQNIENPWEYKSALVSMGLEKEKLDNLTPLIKDDRRTVFNVIIKSTALLYDIHALLNEVIVGSGRISEIVIALKNYSFLDRDAMEEINIHKGIDNTLVILRSKLKKGIHVNKIYSSNLQKITAVGRELNQVWTNIIDNAVDAMDGKGEITITTKNDGDYIIVQIENDGPEIPKYLQSKIFDPFFTTKEPGKGIGLGLSTSYSIVTEKQKGTITLRSDSISTSFEVRLPVNLDGKERSLND